MNRRRSDILDVGEPTLRRRRTDERSQNETSVSGGPATNKVTSTTVPRSDGDAEKTEGSQKGKSFSGGKTNKVTSTTVPRSDGDAEETEGSQNETSFSGGATNKVTFTTVPRSDGHANETAAERRCFDWNLVCYCGGGSARRKNDCDTLSTDTFPDRYRPTWLVTEGIKFHSPYCVELSSSSVLCMGMASGRRWLKHKAKQCGKGNKEKEGDSGEAQEWAKEKKHKEGNSDKAPNSDENGTKGEGQPQKKRRRRSPKVKFY
ncbi:uncharacterized protein [Montipora foliosa]|uniref:uncharacterized protein n=1 Tax=Montipora foliosa TaxID=591990 RepID=UPI0035F10A52